MNGEGGKYFIFVVVRALILRRGRSPVDMDMMLLPNITTNALTPTNPASDKAGAQIRPWWCTM